MKLPRRNPALPTSGPGRSERLLPEPPHRPAGWARGMRGSKIYHSRQKVCIIRQVGPAGRAGSRSTTEDERYGPPTGTGPERFTNQIKCPRLISPLNEHLSLMNDFESSMLYIYVFSSPYKDARPLNHFLLRPREKLHLTGHGFPKTIHTLMLARPKGKLHLTGHDSVFQKQFIRPCLLELPFSNFITTCKEIHTSFTHSFIPAPQLNS